MKKLDSFKPNAIIFKHIYENADSEHVTLTANYDTGFFPAFSNLEIEIDERLDDDHKCFLLEFSFDDGAFVNNDSTDALKKRTIIIRGEGRAEILALAEIFEDYAKFIRKHVK